MSLAGLLPLLLLAQVPNPPYDPNDPEGFVPYPNKTGRYAWKRQGTWTTAPLRPHYLAPGVARPSAAELERMTAVLNALSALLKSTPEGTERRGYFMKEPRLYRSFNPFDLPAGVSPAALPLNYDAGFYPFYNSDTLKNGVYVTDTGGETEGVYFQFNLLPGKMTQPVIAKEETPDRRIEFYLRPDLSLKYRGYPVIDGQDLMIARAGRDPWAPVPYGRVLKAAMVHFESDRKSAEDRLAGLKKKEAEAMSPEYEQAMRDHLEKYSGQFRATDPKKWEGRLAGMERELKYNRDKAKKEANPQRDKEGAWYWNPIDAHEEAKSRLAALSAADAVKPACYQETKSYEGRYAMRGRILWDGEDLMCRPIVSDNHAYFDPKLPRDAPQILLVRTFGRCAKYVDGKFVGPVLRPSLAPPQGCFRHFPIWEAMDWAKVAALLVP
jgi:hypothetical protein